MWADILTDFKICKRITQTRNSRKIFSITETGKEWEAGRGSAVREPGEKHSNVNRKGADKLNRRYQLKLRVIYPLQDLKCASDPNKKGCVRASCPNPYKLSKRTISAPFQHRIPHRGEPSGSVIQSHTEENLLEAGFNPTQETTFWKWDSTPHRREPSQSGMQAQQNTDPRDTGRGDLDQRKISNVQVILQLLSIWMLGKLIQILKMHYAITKQA